MENRVYHQIENTVTYEFCTDLHFGLPTEGNDTEIPHFHKNFEILTVIRGGCRCKIGEWEQTLRGGEAVFIMPFQIHAFCPLEGSEVRRVSLHDHLIWSLASALEKKTPKMPLFAPTDIIFRFFTEQLQALFGSEAVRLRRIPSRQRMMVKGCLYIAGSAFLEQAELIPSSSADALMTEVV
ncbi:MAG: cupin domain-containing protein, partial [Clostridia bacterium]|nr:cupin domain-containing protein [Clostridia bacterium]